jgi:hypothetical protein
VVVHNANAVVTATPRARAAWRVRTRTR